MGAELHLWPQQPVFEGDTVTLSVRIEGNSRQHRELWFRVPVDWKDAVTKSMDPYVLGTIHLAMSEGSSLRVHGEVSPSLKNNLEEFQQAWSIWRPHKYQPVEIIGEKEEEAGPPSARKKIISAFSGGVDSSFTVFRHRTGNGVRSPMNLAACVMVHGFDIPLDQPEIYEQAAARARRQLDGLGIELIPIATNCRSFGVEWSDAFGAFVSSSIMLFQGAFDGGLIAGGVPFHCYDHLIEGSNPLTDPLLSSQAFPIIPDGAGFTRADKIEVLAEWPEALEHLRVCWAGDQLFKNCCTCEKCVRNILTFRALGLGLPLCFDADVSDERIRDLVPLKEIIMRVGYDVILDLAEKRGVDDSWVNELKRCVRKNRRRNKSKILSYSRRLKAKAAALLAR